MERSKILRIVITALFTALIAAGAFIKIPLGPVPVTLQTLFVLIAVCSLPLSLSVLSVLTYLVLGAIGLPVFTTGGGIAALLGPTGGYLLGILPAVIAGSLIMKVMGSHIRLAACIAAAVTDIIIYAVGIPWLSIKLDLSFAAALATGLFPFIIGDVIKYIVTVITAPAIRNRAQELLDETD